MKIDQAVRARIVIKRVSGSVSNIGPTDNGTAAVDCDRRTLGATERNGGMYILRSCGRAVAESMLEPRAEQGLRSAHDYAGVINGVRAAPLSSQSPEIVNSRERIKEKCVERATGNRCGA